MSLEDGHIVEVVTIKEIKEHPNADRLELAAIKGWQCVVQKNKYKSGDKVIYIPIDSILPAELEEKIFGKDSKVKLTKSRVKTIRLRGAISQGLVIPMSFVNDEDLSEGTDVRERLGIVKYEPPHKPQRNLGGGSKRVKKEHPDFYKYTKWQNVKNYPELFKEGEQVCVTEKVHGTNFRCGYVCYRANTLWKKLKKLLGLAPSHEFVFGSHNVQLDGIKNKGYYEENVYAEIVEKYNLKNVLKPGEVVYGEIYGDGIQTNYNYGLKNERKFVAFDVMINGEYLPQHQFLQWVEMKKSLVKIQRIFYGNICFDHPPIIYTGPFNYELIISKLTGSSVLCPEQKTIEGGVCKSLEETSSYIGRKGLKFINDEYLLKDNTEYH